jgi:hypothetical protein
MVFPCGRRFGSFAAVVGFVAPGEGIYGGWKQLNLCRRGNTVVIYAVVGDVWVDIEYIVRVHTYLIAAR